MSCDSGRFDWFVMLAGMRTGSNLLESHLNAVPGVTCHGEAFNPAFIGYPKADDLLGVTLDERLTDPGPLLDRLRAAPGLNGFRLFHNHDPRALARVLADPRCAKIVLTRNPLESYVSRKIARKTGQWILRGNGRTPRTAKVRFDGAEFQGYAAEVQEFHRLILHELQCSGQTAYYLDYEDLTDPAVIDGLLAFLGLAHRPDRLASDLRKQNPGDLAEKVTNPAEIARTLARMDRFNLTRTPSFEPRRGPSVPSFLASGAGLVFMPVRSAPVDGIRRWLEGTGTLRGDFTRKTLREWKRTHPGHLHFTVLRHPVARAYAAFRDTILSGRYAEIRAMLIRVHGLVLPAEAGLPDDDAGLRLAFHGFLRWLGANLAGQTAVRVDGAWASQSAVLAGFAGFALPDMILRETRLADDLPRLAAMAGADAPAWTGDPAEDPAPVLRRIYDAETERLARDAYARDYIEFGFADWAGSG